jgi:hypothetical protein
MRREEKRKSLKKHLPPHTIGENKAYCRQCKRKQGEYRN